MKLFHPQYAYAVDLELGCARAVQALGAPCPAVFEKVEHEGRTGIVYERIDGPLLLDGLRDGSASTAEVAERLAALHLELHAFSVPASAGLRSLRDWLASYLDGLPEPVRTRGRAELAQVPDDTGLCHMDLHPGNVIVRGGELVVVDWVNACAGPLALDVGRSISLIAWQSATKRDGRRQAWRLELAARYREAMEAQVAPPDVARALGFACDALLRAEPNNAFAPELQAAIPWR